MSGLTEGRKLVSETDIGNKVLCDAACGADWTSRPESGGMLFGTKAYCPDCAARAMPTILKFHEEHFIKARCPPDMSFADWVRQLRGGDNMIRVYEL